MKTARTLGFGPYMYSGVLPSAGIHGKNNSLWDEGIIEPMEDPKFLGQVQGNRGDIRHCSYKYKNHTHPFSTFLFITMQ